MRIARFCLLAIVIIFGSALAASSEYGDIQVTRWVDPLGRTPLSYEQYIQQHPVRPVRVQRLISPLAATDQTPFVILVDEALYPNISASISTYISDLTSDDFNVMLVQWGGGTAEQVRDSLITWWENGLCDGAVIIGDLPVPWFELFEDFNDDGIPDDPQMVSFPCDLYYMDLDGTWEDQDEDGIFDVHEGNTDAEIWVGELRATTLTWSEVGRVNNYFAKDHAYREGTLILPSLALNYIDDDWAGSANSWGDALRTAFGAVVTFNDINETTALGYSTELQNGYSCIQVATHSSPFVHSFRENNGSSWGYIENWQIRNMDPDAYFYNLFACSNCRYVETDYMGGWYVFADTYGLGAVGSTKTGAMLYFEDYYPVLGEGGTLGEAFSHWISINGNIPGHEMWSRSWFYGMTHLGDPTLRLPRFPRFAGMIVDDDSTGLSRGDGDGIIDAGETIELTVQVENRMLTTCNNVALVLSTDDTLITISSDSSFRSTMPAGGTVNFTGFVMESNPLTPDGHRTLVDMIMTDNQAHIWYDSFELEIAAPAPACASYQIMEIGENGNGNGWVDPGETVELNLLTRNSGGQTIRNMYAYMQVLAGDVAVTNDRVEYDDIEAGERAYSQMPFSFTVGNSQPDQQPLLLEIKYYISEMEISNSVIAVPMSFGYNTTFNFESETSALRTYAVNDAYRNAWHWSTQFAYSGIGSEKFGDVAQGNYPPMADGALEFPLFPIGANATLSLYHKIDAEIGYDGGIVEADTGAGWSLLTPESGYPYTAGDNGSFPAYSPCFSGTSDWTALDFDLPGAAGADWRFAKIRFRFGSDGGVEGMGWFLDNVTFISSSLPVTLPASQPPLPGDFALLPAYPNPFNATTRIEFAVPPGVSGNVALEIFNILGQRVATLWQGNSPGRQVIYWSGADAGGRSLGTGLYFVRLNAPQFHQSRKLILLK
jgi:hypothetical protein